jgi:anti-sigma B factor antagonist
VGDATEVLQIAISRPFANVVLVVLTGELDLVSAGDFARELAPVVLERAALVVVDLAGVAFIDSSGLHMLVQTARQVESNGGIAVLAAPAVATRRVFEIARVGDIMAVAQSREEALARRFTASPSGQTDGPR